MKWKSLLPLCLFAAVATGQAAQPAPDMAHEAHHRLLLENSQVRVFGLTLRANESTFTRHEHSFLLVTLKDCQLVMWRDGESQIIGFPLKQGGLNFISGAFSRGMRNDQKDNCKFLVVEFLDPRIVDYGYDGTSGVPASPMDPSVKDIKSAALGIAYLTTAQLPHGDSMPARPEDVGELLIPVTDVDLKIEDDNHIRESTGEVEWIEAGHASALENAGAGVARFVLFRLRPAAE